MTKLTIGVVYPAQDGQAVQCSCDIQSAEFSLGTIPRAAQLREMLKTVRDMTQVKDGDTGLTALHAIRTRIDAFLVPGDGYATIGNGSLGEDIENMVHNVVTVGSEYDKKHPPSKILRPNGAAVLAADRSKRNGK